MRVYISGPITGVVDYKDKFLKAEKRLAALGFDVINPVAMDSVLPEDATYDEYMEVDICLLGMCEAIYMMENWQNSRGANREYGFAIGRGMKVIFEEVGENEEINGQCIDK